MQKPYIVAIVRKNQITVLKIKKNPTSIISKQSLSESIGNLLTVAPSVSALLISTDIVMDALKNNMSLPQQYGFEKINEIARDVVNAL